MGDAAQELRPRYDNTTDILFRGQQTFANEHADPRSQLSAALRRSTPMARQIAGDRLLLSTGQRAAPGRLSVQRRDAAAGTAPGTVAETRQAADRDYTARRAPAGWPPNECFVASEVSFEQLCGGQAWRQFSSTPDLIAGLHNPSLDFGADIRVAIHSRLVQPLLDITLLFLGLPLVLSRENRNMFAAIGLCVLLVAGFMLLVMACQYLGSSYLLDPALASLAAADDLRAHGRGHVERSCRSVARGQCRRHSRGIRSPSLLAARMIARTPWVEGLDHRPGAGPHGRALSAPRCRCLCRPTGLQANLPRVPAAGRRGRPRAAGPGHSQGRARGPLGHERAAMGDCCSLPPPGSAPCW